MVHFHKKNKKQGLWNYSQGKYRQKHVYYFPFKKSSFQRENIQKTGRYYCIFAEHENNNYPFLCKFQRSKIKILYCLHVEYTLKLNQNTNYLTNLAIWNKNNVTKCYNIFIEKEKSNRSVRMAKDLTQKFQNHIYGHNLADDKIKTDHRQIMSKNTQT